MKLHTLLSLVFILVSGNSFTAHQQDFYPEELACYHPFFSPAFNTPCLRTEEAQAGVTSYVAQNGPMNSIIPLTLSTDTALHMAINIARPDLASLFLDVLDPGNRTVVCTCTDGYHNTILLTTLKFLKRLLARRQALPQQIYQGTIEQSHSEVISNTIAFLYKILPHSNLLYVNQASPYPSEHHSAISYFQNRLYTGEQRQHLDEYIATYLANHSDARPLPEFFEATHQRDSEITETLTKQGEELQTVKEKLAQQAAELAAAQAKQQKLEEHIARLTITQASSPDPEFLRHSSQQDLPTSLIQACGTSNSPITSPDHNSSANQGKQITTSLPRSLLPKIDNTGPLDQSESKPQSPTPPPLAQKGTAKNQGSNTSEVPQDIPSSVTAEDNESDFIAEQPRALSRPDDQQGSSAAKLKRLRQQQALQEATRQEEQKKKRFFRKKTSSTSD